MSSKIRALRHLSTQDLRAMKGLDEFNSVMRELVTRAQLEPSEEIFAAIGEIVFCRFENLPAQDRLRLKFASMSEGESKAFLGALGRWVKEGDK